MRQLQVEHLVRCMPSPYQQALFSIVKQQLTAEGDAAAPKRTVAVSNSVMELRNICNHPTIRLLSRGFASWQCAAVLCCS